MTRYKILKSILDSFNQNKSYKIILGPLGAFLSVEIRFLEYLCMPEEQIIVLANARRDRKTLIIDEVIPEIVQKNLRLSSHDVVAKFESYHSLVSKKQKDDVQQEEEGTHNSSMKKENLAISREIILDDRFDKYSNEKPKPYLPPIKQDRKKRSIVTVNESNDSRL